MAKIVLVGSSIFQQWRTAAEVFPQHTVINCAIGGTTTAQWLDLLRPVCHADTSGAVCHAALLALGKVESDLDAGQRERLQQGARRLTAHGHHGARLEATIRVENFVSGCSTIRRRWCGCAAIGRRRLGRGFSKWVRGTGARIRGMRSTMKADPRPEA